MKKSILLGLGMILLVSIVSSQSLTNVDENKLEVYTESKLGNFKDIDVISTTQRGNHTEIVFIKDDTLFNDGKRIKLVMSNKNYAWELR